MLSIYGHMLLFLLLDVWLYYVESCIIYESHSNMSLLLHL